MTATDRVAAIRARLAAATPGPWKWFGRGHNRAWALGHRSGRGSAVLDGDLNGDGDACVGFNRRADATLIANAPADLAWLLEENARLTAELESWDDHSCWYD